MTATPNTETAAVKIDLQDEQPDPLDGLGVDALREMVEQLQATVAAKTAEIDQVRDQNVALKHERDEYDLLAKDAIGKKAKAERDLEDERRKVGGLTGQVSTAQHRADQLEKEASNLRRSELEAKAAAVEAAIRAEAAEQRLAEVTAPKPDGHIIAKNLTEAELNAFAEQGRDIAHYQFMPDGTLNAVVKPLPAAPEEVIETVSAYSAPRMPRNQPTHTPTSRIPIPPTAIRLPSTPMPSVNAMGTERMPCALTPVTKHDESARIPTFSEILAARLSGQINAEQFTKYANALAGHNAAQKVAATS